MKKIFFSSLAIAALMLFFSVGSAIAAQNAGFYVGVFGGYVVPQTMEMDPNDSTVGRFDATLENGYLLGIRTGWYMPFTRSIMAMEVEYNYLNNNFDNNKVIPSPDNPGFYATLDGNMSIHAVLFNFKARYPEGVIHPYAGVGLGYAYASVGDITEREYGGPNVSIWPSESGGGFCWQFLAGVDLDIAPHVSVGVGYKYFAAYPAIGDKYDHYYDHNYYADLDYRASLFTAGITFTF